jgi:hypothetical protein
MCVVFLGESKAAANLGRDGGSARPEEFGTIANFVRSEVGPGED